MGIEALRSGSFLRSRAVSYVSLSLACLMWGASFVLGKIALKELPFTELLVLRFSLASLLCLPLTMKRRPRGREWWRFLFAAFLTVPATLLLQFGGLAATSAGHAALLIGFTPAVMVAVSFLFLRKPVPRKDILASFAAVAGVLIIVPIRGSGGGPSPALIGDLLVLASTIAIAGWVLAQRKLLQTRSVAFVSPWMVVLGTVMLLPVLLAGPVVPMSALSRATWLAVLGLAVFPTLLSQLLWNRGMKGLAAHQAGVFLALEPLGGVLLSTLLLGEAFGASLGIATLLILGAMVTTALPEKRTRGDLVTAAKVDLP
jgi:drug/metabolite transporter (DMT)-like permease